MAKDFKSSVQQFARRLKGVPEKPALSVLELQRGSQLHAEGMKYAGSGEWTRALAAFEAAVRESPDQPNFNYTYGMALCHARRFVEAIRAFKCEIGLVPQHGSALTELGACLARSGQVREGIAYLRKGLRHMPNLPIAHYNLALALLGDNHRLEAIESCSRALALNRAYADAYGLRGLAHAMGDEEEKSLSDLYAAASLDNKHSQLLVSLGTDFAEKSRETYACNLFELAAKISPDMALSQYAFGHFLINNRAFDLGLEYVERAIELDPKQAPSYVAKGFGCLGQGRIEEAVAAFRHGCELAPDSAKTAGTLLFALQHKPGVTRGELLEAHKNWGDLFSPKVVRNRVDFKNVPDPGRKLRIGLVSADLNRHAVSFLTMRAFEELAALGYEIHCFKTDRKRKDDDYSARYKRFSKSWHDVSDLDDRAFAALIERQKIDILFDLSGHTAGCRLAIFAARTAPVQLSWAGYVGTVGLSTYDGVVADPVEIPPEHEAAYLEPVVRLPDCYVCYYPPAEAPPIGPLPVIRKKAFTFGCFNRPAKLNAEVARTWVRILDQVEDARILIVYGGLSDTNTREAVYKVFESGGLSRDRVDLVGDKEQSSLLKAYAEEVDLALDPFPYSGGVTTLEAMWMGVPTVTFVGDTFAGRHSASHLSAAGLSDFCTYSVEDYIDLAVGWTKRTDELAALRLGLREKVAASPLNDHVRFGCNLDRALRELWQKWCFSRQNMQGFTERSDAAAARVSDAAVS